MNSNDRGENNKDHPSLFESYPSGATWGCGTGTRVSFATGRFRIGESIGFFNPRRCVQESNHASLKAFGMARGTWMWTCFFCINAVGTIVVHATRGSSNAASDFCWTLWVDCPVQHFGLCVRVVLMCLPKNRTRQYLMVNHPYRNVHFEVMFKSY